MRSATDLALLRRTRDDAGTTFRIRIFRRRGGGTGVTSREGARDSGHVYESLVFAGLALPARTSRCRIMCSLAPQGSSVVRAEESNILNFDQNKAILVEICQSKLRVRTEELWSYANPSFTGGTAAAHHCSSSSRPRASPPPSRRPSFPPAPRVSPS